MLGLGRSSEHLRLAAMLTRLTGLYGTDAVWPHHLVVFVLYDVVVPDELRGRVELCPHACDLARIRNYGVLETVFARLGRPGYRSGNDLNPLVVLVHDDILPIDYLEHDFVNVYRRGIRGRVVELPDLGRPKRRVLSDRIFPLTLCPGSCAVAVEGDRAEQRFRRRVLKNG